MLATLTGHFAFLPQSFINDAIVAPRSDDPKMLPCPNFFIPALVSL
jgi:hypothetical protein